MPYIQQSRKKIYIVLNDLMDNFVKQFFNNDYCFNQKEVDNKF